METKKHANMIKLHTHTHTHTHNVILKTQIMK